jgi:5-methylcytosine-specific restriction endonuclease McrA
MQLDLNSDMKSIFNTDGRTDERDEDGPSVAIKLQPVTRERVDDPRLVGELIDPTHWLRTSQRHPVVRTGDREEIPPHVRIAVRLRDKGRCELCGWRYVDGEWHLDHITPWSAGGSDRSDNLRVLCAEHNERRSNHIDTFERPRRPVTWWCINCYGVGAEWHYGDSFGVRCGRHGQRFCQVRRIYDWNLQEFGSWPEWHKRRPVEASATLAYCAHCNAPAMTDVTL